MRSILQKFRLPKSGVETQLVSSQFNIPKIGQLYFDRESNRPISGGEFVQEAINTGWLSEDKIKRVIREDGEDALPGFLENLAWLVVEAGRHALSDSELKEMKTNMGLISSDIMRNSLEVRKK